MIDIRTTGMPKQWTSTLHYTNKSLVQYKCFRNEGYICKLLKDNGDGGFIIKWYKTTNLGV